MYPAIQESKSYDDRPHAAGIHIAVADDYPVLLAGMRQLLATCEDIAVVAECTRFSDLLPLLGLKKPEIILFGCETNLETLAEQLHCMIEHHADAKVVVFTGNASLDFHEVALRNGARGVLLKHCAPHLIAKTIRRVSQGELCFDSALTDRMLRTFVRRRQPDPLRKTDKISSLTGRESQVISSVCQGMRNKEIARKLYISDATVAHHLTSIYRKLGLTDRTELLLFAHHNGLSTLKAS
jgi:DNA-binding NarL/FixJ family response regulator